MRQPLLFQLTISVVAVVVTLAFDVHFRIKSGLKVRTRLIRQTKYDKQYIA
jgi:hypothetical protein